MSFTDDTTALPLESSFDIHLGLVEAYADMFVSQMQKLGVETHQDGDGWEEWGTAMGESLNDQNTFHIVLRFDRVEKAIMSAIQIAQKYIDILTPMRRQVVDTTHNGIKVSVTFSGNWSEGVVDIHQTESRTFVAKFRAQQVALPYK